LPPLQLPAICSQPYDRKIMRSIDIRARAPVAKVASKFG